MKANLLYSLNNPSYGVDMSQILFFESMLRMPLGLVMLPLRCTLVKTASAVIMISPIDFTAQQLQEIADFGKVTDVVAPSLIHHLFVKKALQKFKNVNLWGPPGCQEKRPDLPWTHIFERDPWPHTQNIEALLIAGAPKLNEMAFFDKTSRTLIVVDFCFNLLNPQGWCAPVMLRLLGTYKKFGVSRIVKRFLVDKEAFLTSTKKLLSWDFEQIAMAHGDLITANGKFKLMESLRERKLL